MKTEINVPEYTASQGLRTEWDYGFTIAAQIQDGGVLIKANRAGLISLARHLLTLAQEQVPTGHHIHLDDSNALEDGSCELILEKIGDG
jgi:hypothetical protein